MRFADRLSDLLVAPLSRGRAGNVFAAVRFVLYLAAFCNSETSHMAALAKGRCPTCAINLVGASVGFHFGFPCRGICTLVDGMGDCFMLQRQLPDWKAPGIMQSQREAFQATCFSSLAYVMSSLDPFSFTPRRSTILLM